DDREREKFTMLRAGILNRTLVSFDYFSSYGEKTRRTVEPVKLIFKGANWYLYGYCRDKNDFRIFTITRMKEITALSETFERDIPSDIWSNNQSHNYNMVVLILKIDRGMAYRVYVEYDKQCIQKNADGSFTVTVSFPEDEWI